jgi:hypothetical protein
LIFPCQLKLQHKNQNRKELFCTPFLFWFLCDVI